MADITTNTLKIGSDTLVLRDADAQSKIATNIQDISDLKSQTFKMGATYSINASNKIAVCNGTLDNIPNNVIYGVSGAAGLVNAPIPIGTFYTVTTFGKYTARSRGDIQIVRLDSGDTYFRIYSEPTTGNLIWSGWQLITTLQNTVTYKTLASEQLFNMLRSLNGNYRLNTLTYVDGYFYLMGGDVNTSGKSKIIKTSSLRFNPLDGATTAIADLGHCNDCTYNTNTGKIVINCGGGSSSGELPFKNKIAIMNPDDMSFELVSLNANYNVYGVEYFNGKIIVLYNLNNVFYIAEYNDDLSQGVVVASFTKQRLLTFLHRSDEENVLIQNITSDGSDLYITVSLKTGTADYNTFFTGCLIRVNLWSGQFVECDCFGVNTAAEFEGALYKDDQFYAVCDGNFISAVKINKFNNVQRRQEIPGNTDLNSILTVGRFFASGAGVTATLRNKPAALTAGFFMDVINVGSINIKQIIHESSSTCNTFYRFYNSDNTFSAWYKVNLTSA